MAVDELKVTRRRDEQVTAWGGILKERCRSREQFGIEFQTSGRNDTGDKFNMDTVLRRLIMDSVRAQFIICVICLPFVVQPCFPSSKKAIEENSKVDIVPIQLQLQFTIVIYPK